MQRNSGFPMPVTGLIPGDTYLEIQEPGTGPTKVEHVELLDSDSKDGNAHVHVNRCKCYPVDHTVMVVSVGRTVPSPWEGANKK